MIDDQGFPGARGLKGEYDGGDTCAILGTILTLLPPDEDRQKWISLRQACTPFTNPVRHPDKSRWYGQSDRFSRDQMIPLLCSYVGEPEYAHILFEAHKKNWFLWAWNTRKNGEGDLPLKTPDPTGPEIWALWLRVIFSTEPWYRQIFEWLLLCILDLETLVGSILWRLRPKSNVTRNHMLVAITARANMPTPTSWMAFKINDFVDLISRWKQHCLECKEYETWELFDTKIKSLVE